MRESNRYRVAAVGAIAIEALVAVVVLAAPTLAAGRSVAIKDESFSPATITIRAGDTITWTNRGVLVHNVIFASFGSKMYMDPGDRFTHRFSSAGTFNYQCTLHAINAKVIVTRAPTPQPTKKPAPKPTPSPTATPKPTPSPSPSPSPTPTSTPSPTATPTPTPAPTPSPTSTPFVPEPTTPASDMSGLPLLVLVALAIAGVVGVGAVVVRRR
jgi:plastocyanin